MTGALLQLVSIGNQDQYFIGNPKMSHFKGVYRNYSNFAMENLNVVFDSGPPRLNLLSKSTYITKIPYYGDMISKILFEFDLPNVNKTGFKWIDNIGTSIIDSIKIYVGDKLIEELTGEYIHCYYNTTLTSEKLKIYNDMIGNTNDVTNVSNTKSAKHITVPIPFWFTKYEGVELPLIALNQTKITVKLELKSVDKLYTIYDTPNYILPKLSNLIPSWDFNANLSINYIFLNDAEAKLMKDTEHQYLIDRIQIQEHLGNVYNSKIELKLFNPIKELFFIPKRDDIRLTNEYSNYTNVTLKIPNSLINNNKNYYSENIVEEMAIFLNGDQRTISHSYDYYHTVQPYLYHTNKLPPGVLMYSFAIHPEKYQPSGACNFTNFKPIELEIKFKNPKSIPDNTEKNIKYDFTVYASSYNILKIEKGHCNLLFST